MSVVIRRDDWENDKQFDAIKRLAAAIDKSIGGAAQFVVGMIQLWYGAAADVPDGWQVCDGTNGTPDMRNRFAVGAGSTYALDATGGATSVTSGSGGASATDSGGSGTSGSGGGADTGATTLTLSQIPAHSHTLYVWNSTGFDANVDGFNYSGGGYDVAVAGEASGGNAARSVNDVSTQLIGDSGSGGSHVHTTSAHTHSVPAHTHTIASHTHSVSTLPPYRALYYIMYIGS